MNLLMSDIPLPFLQMEGKENRYVDLSALRIANCVGCFGCWVKTPGRCVIRDDAVKVYPLIARSERLIYVTKVELGSYGTVMKTMLERSIPVQQAFIRLLDGETHHVQRKVAPKTAVIIGYGDISPKEQEIFRALVERNAKNMSFKSYRIIFVAENQVEAAASNEVTAWEK